MKKAYLVSFVITTRIICEEIPEDSIYTTDAEEIATAKLLKDPSSYIIGDNISDVTEDFEMPYEEGEGELPEFAHSDLHSNFVADGCFPASGKYKTWIDQTQNSPECFQLTIEEDGNGETWEYLYDDKESAFKDLETFYAHLNVLKAKV